jgi:hypothetical protein
VGVCLVVLVVAVQMYVTARWEVSSTASVGYLYLPIFGFLIVGAGVFVERNLGSR